MKIIFMGTGVFASTVLQKLIDSGLELSAVITQPDKPSGREQDIVFSPVKNLAVEKNLEVYQPKSLIKIDGFVLIEKLAPDLIIVADYGKIIPKNILDLPKFGTLNIHPSLLPKHRGPSPLQETILNGDKETGVTVILLDEEMDHGPIVGQEKLEIGNQKYSLAELRQKLAELGGDLATKVLPDYLSGKIKPITQDHNRATYTKIIAKEDGKINWEKSAEEIDCQLRAYGEWPGSWTEWENNSKKYKLKIIEAEILESPRGIPGTIYVQNNNLTVQCGRNSLIIKSLQLEGKNKTSGQEFLRGYPKIISSTLK
ncbi:methionyl-tRNA formyltransferase [Candidatus Falkowbacteria bacterium RIFOXYB2_FULL_38_15]|uniref:Methionyl-tRNA formyltransferase n=1 Tax=Candidatus Falkowbacteria bacterium RIFOXYA2_FULL_38_12 TaxID=1797993 RepID=A0A1F5S4D4_9BACT|nr:MAG: methionyl-tRNA formyltransferase [Candidatus Falkowbacteria bacterium RIFOXYA2_FULL_38_12]OGF33731.1 MAG: methionyl-tRNA formyltransferase [Candidatus Falkowbacteria bacterium RIFOXYB2_FULL_38_15]OGF42400.1 MAG: methionyl-tRNA formyltransferase [Candidatus Falkowbacteria bacterium RIFOXYD2_FULL_39_16]